MIIDLPVCARMDVSWPGLIFCIFRAGMWGIFRNIYAPQRGAVSEQERVDRNAASFHLVPGTTFADNLNVSKHFLEESSS
jgi:hypothetical protein